MVLWVIIGWVRRGIIQPVRRLISGPPAAAEVAGQDGKDAVKGEDVGKEACEPGYGGQEKSCVTKRPGGGGGWN